VFGHPGGFGDVGVGRLHEALDADLAQAGHAEERAVHVRPVFQGDEGHRSDGHVRDQHPQARRGRHDHPRLLLRLLVVQVPRATAAGLVFHAALVHPRVQPSEGLGQHLYERIARKTYYPYAVLSPRTPVQ